MNFKDLFDRAVAANLAYIHWMPANASSGAAMWAQAVAARQLSPRWAEAFLSAADGRRWSIPEAGIALNDSSGFAAHILQTEAGKILCVRGTEFNASLGNVIASLLPGVTLEEQTRKDLLGADWDIAALGIAVEQAVSLANFVRRLQAPLGAEVAQCVVLRPELQRFFLAPDWEAWPLLLLDRPHLFAVSFSTTTATGLGVLAPGEQLEIAGHSLGGHLAAIGLRLFPELFTQATVFNAAGVAPLGPLNMVDTVFDALVDSLGVRPASNFESLTPRLINVVSESSAIDFDLSLVPSFLTGAWRYPQATPVRTELNSHSLDPIVDSLCLLALLEEFAPAASVAERYALFDAASARPEATVETLTRDLGALLSGPAEIPIVAPGLTGYADDTFGARSVQLDSLWRIREVLQQHPELSLTSLVERAPSALFSLAQTSVGARYALRSLVPFLLSGNDGLYPAIDREFQPGLCSAAEWQDRAEFFFWEMNRRRFDDVSSLASGAPALHWTDLAHGLDFAGGSPAPGRTLPTALRPRVVFGSDMADDLSLLSGTAQNDRLYGAGGADQLFGAEGADRLEGGADHDVLSGGPGADTLFGGDGDDTLWGSAEDAPDDGECDVLTGGEGMDTLWAGSGDIVIDDTGSLRVRLPERWLDVAAAAWRPLASGDGIKRFETTDAEPVSLLWNTVAGELRVGGVTVKDFASGHLGIALPATPSLPLTLSVIPGTPEDDRLTGTAGADSLLGAAGADWLSGLSGDDSLFGGSGADILEAGEGDDWLAGESGRDALLGGVGNDHLMGGDEADALSGDDGADWLEGGNGNDVLGGGGGSDLLRGGAGNDLLVAGLWFDAPLPDWEVRRGPTPMGQVQRDPRNVQLLSFPLINSWEANAPNDPAGDALYGDDGVDFLIGSAGADLLEGGDGDDVALGGDGNDRLVGGEGADHLRGSGGADVLEGGPGKDFLVGDGTGDDGFEAPGNDWLVGGDGSDELQGLGGHDRLFGDADADLLYGGESDDWLAGGDGDDALYGDAGLDELQGQAGDDRLYGEAENDTLSGGAGADFVSGGDGDDGLAGDEGADQLLGGTGADTLHGGADNDVLLGESGADVLDGGEGDDRLFGGTGHDVYVLGAKSGRDLIVESGGDDELHLPFVHSLAALTPQDEQGTLRLRLGEQDELRIANWRDGGIECLRFGRNGVLDAAHLLQPEFAGVAARVSAAGAAGSAGDDALTLTLASGQVSAGAGNDRYLLTAGTRVEITDPDTANTLVFPDGASPAGLRLSGTAERWQIALDSTVVTTAPNTFQRYVFGGGLVLTATELKTLALAQIPLAPAVVEQIPNRGLLAGARFQFDLPANAFVDPNPHSFLQYGASLANGDPLPSWLEFSAYSGAFYGLAPAGLQLSLNVVVSAEDPTGLRGAQTFGLDVMPPFKQGASAVLSCYALNAQSGSWLQVPGTPFGAAPPPRVTALGDLNVDGQDDLLIDDRIVWGNRRGLGETLALNALPLGASTRLLASPDGPGFDLAPAFADLNGDGRQDLLLSGADGEARVLLAQAGVWPALLAVDALPTVSSAISEPITPLDASMPRWDFNGDGWADAPLESVDDRGLTELAINLGGPRPARLTLDGAPYGFTAGTPLSDALARSAWGELRALGDVNGDGLGDLGLGSAPYLFENDNAYGAVIFGRRDGVLPRLTELNGSNGFLLAFPAPGTGYAKRHAISAVGDVNGDGYADLLGSDDATGASFLVYGRSAFGGALEIGTAADDFIAVAQSCTVQGGSGDDHIKISGEGQFAVYPGSGHNTVEIAPAAGGRINLVSESGGDLYQLLNSADATIYISNNGDLGGRLALPPGVSASSVRLGQGSVLIDTGTGLNIHLEDVDFNDVLGGPRTLDLITFADGTVWRYEDLIARGFDLEGSAQADTLRGSNVVDRIVAGAGNDVLEGLAGEDVLDGGAGDDTYTFKPGSGADSLRDASGRDVLRYPALSSAEALRFSHEGRDLLISQASGEALRILDWNAELSARIELLICADQAPLDLPALVNRAPVTVQTSMTVSAMAGDRLELQLPRDAIRDPDALDTLQWQLSAESGQWPAGLGFDPQTLRLSGTPSAPGSYPLLLSATDDFGATATLACALSIQSRPVPQGSDRDDELQGSAGPDVLYGLAGHDRLWGLAGNDRLFGGAGSDALFGAAGNDLLDGGPGADRLAGGAGNDRYVFARGSGSDHIVNDDIAGNDEIVFMHCRPRDLSFHRQGTALEITRRGSGDRVQLPHWFDSPAARVDHIRLDDGHDLRAADVAVLVQAMARFEPASGAARPLSTAQALALEPVLAAVWH